MILILLSVVLLAGFYLLTLASLAWQDVVLAVGVASVLLWAFRRFLLPARLHSMERTLKAVVMFPLLAFMAVRDIVQGTWTVAMIVIGIRPLEHPGVVAVPIADRTATGVGLSSMLLTLSPGSFLVDVDWDNQVMLIHVMDASDPDAVREDLQTFYDRYQRHVVP